MYVCMYVNNNRCSAVADSKFVYLSQCSTLVRNTVVRATFKVNGKPPISGGRSPLTP